MRSQPAITLGCIAFPPVRSTPRPQVGGRRPPYDPNGSRSHALARLPMRRKGQALCDWLSFCSAAGISVAIAATIVGGVASAEPLPNLNGTYRCEGEPKVCERSGSTFVVTQSGSDLQIKNEKGETGDGKLTSNISLSVGPIWNMLGVIGVPDNRLIQWSNGTTWRKQ
jgi:hypothetical protein